MLLFTAILAISVPADCPSFLQRVFHSYSVPFVSDSELSGLEMEYRAQLQNPNGALRLPRSFTEKIAFLEAVMVERAFGLHLWVKDPDIGKPLTKLIESFDLSQPVKESKLRIWVERFYSTLFGKAVGIRSLRHLETKEFDFFADREFLVERTLNKLKIVLQTKGLLLDNWREKFKRGMGSNIVQVPLFLLSNYAGLANLYVPLYFPTFKFIKPRYRAISQTLNRSVARILIAASLFGAGVQLTEEFSSLHQQAAHELAIREWEIKKAKEAVLKESQNKLEDSLLESWINAYRNDHHGTNPSVEEIETMKEFFSKMKTTPSPETQPEN